MDKSVKWGEFEGPGGYLDTLGYIIWLGYAHVGVRARVRTRIRERVRACVRARVQGKLPRGCIPKYPSIRGKMTVRSREDAE